jgi:hypothetical protein
MWTLSRRCEPQDGQRSYIGGKPSLPPRVKVPVCGLCGQDQTFMFQVAFPSGAEWNGRTLSCFSCTRCADRRFLIPVMLEDQRRGFNIPAQFLKSYGINFTFLVFPTDKAVIAHDYTEQVSFSALQMKRGSKPGDFGKIGGVPDWILEDESPATYNSKIPMLFLLELKPSLLFPMAEGALPQVKLNLFGHPAPSRLDHYKLFLGNAIYFFGTSRGKPIVYAVTQV